MIAPQTATCCRQGCDAAWEVFRNWSQNASRIKLDIISALCLNTLDGVIATIVGYTGGRKTNPSHEDVTTGRTGHALAVQLLYDPQRLSYRELLDVFWHNIDPTVPNRQFCAKGAQYRAAIFYHDEAQKHLAESSKQALAASQRFAKRIVTSTAGQK